MLIRSLFVLIAAPVVAIAGPVRIVATDSELAAPASISAGMRHVVFENRSEQIHEAMFVKLPTGMSAMDYEALVRGGQLFPKGALDYSGPGLTSPGQGTELWLHLDAGEYALICWHHPRVSVRALSVRESTEPDDLPPKEDVTVKLLDYRFEIVGQIRKGMQVMRFETPGPSMHEADIFLLNAGRSAADVQRWYKNDDIEGPAPAVALGGVLDSHDVRRLVWIRKRFAPGHYVLHCAMPMAADAKSGVAHATHADAGMVASFEVKE